MDIVSESLSIVVLTSSNALLDNTELKALTLWYFCWIWPPTNSKMGVSRVERKPSTWLSSCQKYGMKNNKLGRKPRQSNYYCKRYYFKGIINVL